MIIIIIIIVIIIIIIIIIVKISPSLVEILDVSCDIKSNEFLTSWSFGNFGTKIDLTS